MDCTCVVRAPITHGEIGRSINRYAIYMSFIEDDTEFDDDCPFHGANGTMVVTVKVS